MTDDCFVSFRFCSVLSCFFFFFLLHIPSFKILQKANLSYQRAPQIMPLAPTPLSGCPLRRLEIHDGSTSTVYDAAQQESCLTATLEARRAIAGDANDMMLQSHVGVKRVLSIQLTELIASSNNILETITVDRPSHRMCIQIHQKKQTAVFTFKETRDLNVAIYALKKFGFQVKDGISDPLHAAATSLARSQSFPTPSPNDFAPRLSSITPLDRHGSSPTQSQFSFLSMLNSDVPLTQLQSTDVQYQPLQSPPQDLSPQPEYQAMTGNNYAPCQGPYQSYLAPRSDVYQPRVSSPLRNVVDVNSQDICSMSSLPSSQSSVISNVKNTGSLLSDRSVSDPNTSSQPWPQPICMDMSDYDSACSQETPQASQDTVASTAEGSQTTDESDVSYTLQATDDFRALMPRTRKLPFLRDRKSTTPRSESAQKRTNMEQGRCKSDLNILPREGISSSDSEMDRPSASQTNVQPTPSQPTDTQTEIPAICHSSCEIDELPSMFVADNEILKRLNKETSKLLDQYTADIGRGCDAAACAQFYLGQIDAARIDFWLNKLKQTSYTQTKY
ncbi:hypothetical protein J3F84DRAFT_223228 [Trichoderma pleuroticola]